MFKQLKRNAKTLGIFLAIGLIGLPAAGGIMALASYLMRQEAYVIKINDIKIKKDQMPLNFLSAMKKIHFTIEKVVIDKYIKFFHLGASDDELNIVYEEYLNHLKKKIKSGSEEEMIKTAYGMTKKEFLNVLKVNLLREKVEEMVCSSIDKADSKKYFQHWLENEKSNISIEILDDEYKYLLPLPFLSLNSLEINSYDFMLTMLTYLQYPFLLGNVEGSTTEEKAANIVYKGFKQDLLLANEALGRGIRVKEELSSLDKIKSLVKALNEKIKEEADVSNDKIKAYFVNNNVKYIEKERAYANIVFIPFKSSLKDIKDHNKFAEDLHQNAISSNELPKLEIKSLSKAEFSKKYGRKHFRKNEVVHVLLKDGEKKIIAKENNGTINYVVIEPRISAETYKNISEYAHGIYRRIEDGSLSIKDAIDKYSTGKFKKELSIYRDGEYPKEVEKAALQKELSIVQDKEGFYIIKSKIYPKKDVKFDEIFAKVKEDYLNSYVESKLSELITSLSKHKQIKINNHPLKNFISKAVL